MQKLISTLLVIALASIAAMGFELPADLGAAKALSKQTQKPLLIDFYAVWCGPCKWFDSERLANKELQAALEQVVLVRIDAEKGDGPQLFQSYGLQGYPNFILANSEGKTIASILGYGGASDFVARLNKSMADLEPIEDKVARYERQPSAKDALVLAGYYGDRRDSERALTLYREAKKLDPALAADHDFEIFQLEANIAVNQPEAFDKVLEAGNRAMATAEVDEQIEVTLILSALAKKLEHGDVLDDFTRRGLALTEGRTDADSQFARSHHLLNQALYIDKDPAAAFEIKKQGLASGWENDGMQLNNFAWWCFENKVNLEQARAYAEQGVALAEPGSSKAAVLDTLAEILNETGDPAGAVANIKKAISEDPASDYYPKQLKRFESLLEKKTGT